MSPSSSVRLGFLTITGIIAFGMTNACTPNKGVGSATAPSPITTPAAIVGGGTWSLQSINWSDTTMVTTEPGQFTLALGDDGRVTMKVDCNRGTGTYTLAGTTLTVGPLATTKAYCASAPLDDQFLQIIEGQSTVRVAESTLDVSSPRGTLRFSR
jgi:heat shock protein HslJ